MPLGCKSFMHLKYYFLFIFLLSYFVYSLDYAKGSCKEIIQQDTVIINDKMKPLIFITEYDTIKNSSFNTFDYLSKVKVIDSESYSLIQIVCDTGYYWEPTLKFIDINLDNYLDMEFFIGHDNLVPIYSFWIYDSIKSCFIHSQEYSALNDYYIDNENRLIESYAQFMGGRGGFMEKYKIINGHLSLIETEYSERNNYEHLETINGVLIRTRLEKEERMEDDEGNALTVIECYSLIHDSLLLTEINWLTYVDEKITDDMYGSDIYNCEPWGECLKYLRREVYSYDFESNGYIIKDTTRYQIIKNKWEIVKVFNK